MRTNKNSNTLKLFSDPQSEIISTLRQTLDRFFWVLLILGTISVAASILRIFQHGWQTLYIFHVAFYVLLFFIFVFRSLLPVWSIAISLGIAIAIIAFMNLITFGLASTGILTLFVDLAIIGIFFDIKTSIISLAISFVALIIIAIGICTHYFPMNFNQQTYITSSTAWVTHITIFITTVSAVLLSIHSIKSRLINSLNEQLQQSKKLYEINMQLEEKEKKYRLLADNMSDVVFIQDMELNIVYVSPSIRNMFGYTVEETLQLKMNELLTPESLQQAFKTFQYYSSQASQEEIKIPLMQYQYIHKDGSLFWAELRAIFLYDEEGNLEGVQGILRDITIRKKAEEEKDILRDKLIQAEKMEAVGLLAGGVAHDFNNQLAGIVGWTEILKHDYLHEPNVCECAKNILAIVDRTADLTGKLLAFARRGNYHSTQVDVHALISEIISILNHTIDKKIQIEHYFQAQEPIIKGDPSQIQNALLNIAINANDAMPLGGKIIFATKTVELTNGNFPSLHGDILPGQFIQVSIADTGTGISEDIAKRMFEPFYTTKESGKGTGLGLASVYGTLQIHKGGIEVQTEPDKGTTFHLFFPVSPDKDMPVFPQVTSPLFEQSSKGNLLLVEDEDAVRSTTIAILNRLGYSVQACSNGKDAIAVYQECKESIDLVILDVILPGMGGKDVFNSIRQSNPSAKILFYSGYSPDDQLQELLNQAHTGFIQKPFTVDKLLQSIHLLLLG